MKFSKYISKGCDYGHGLVSKAAVLPFKQNYDNVQLYRRERTVNAGTAQSGRYFCRK